jgi:hypothetical protein
MAKCGTPPPSCAEVEDAPALARRSVAWGALQRKVQETAAERCSMRVSALNDALRNGNYTASSSGANNKSAMAGGWGAITAIGSQHDGYGAQGQLSEGDEYGGSFKLEGADGKKGAATATTKGLSTMMANMPLRRRSVLRSVLTPTPSESFGSFEKRFKAPSLSHRHPTWNSQRSQLQKRWLIDPRTSKLMPVLDAAGAIALLFTALFTPFEVAFLTPPGHMDSTFVLNRIVDAIFIADMVAQFLIVIPASGPNGRDIVEHSLIAQRYMSSWFGLDFTSTALSALDILPFVQRDGDGGDAAASTCGSSAYSTLKALRVVRVLRLTKMIRLARATRLLTRWESKVTINYAYLSLCKLAVMVVMYLQ